jgi:TolB protein
MHRITPRTFIAALAIMFSFTAAAVQPSFVDPVRIAIVFAADAEQDADSARDIARRVAADLTQTGRAIVVDPAALSGIVTGIDVIPHFADWRAIGAGALVIGHLARAPDGRLRVTFRLWDVNAGAMLSGFQYSLGADKLAALETVISDTIGDRLAGRLVRFPR